MHKTINSLDLPQAPLSQYPLETRPSLDRARVYTARDPHLCVDICDFLDSTSLSRAAVLCSDDASICTLSELLYELVFRVDDKRRIEGLKRVPLHGHCGCLDGRWKSRRGARTEGRYTVCTTRIRRETRSI